MRYNTTLSWKRNANSCEIVFYDKVTNDNINKCPRYMNSPCYRVNDLYSIFSYNICKQIWEEYFFKILNLVGDWVYRYTWHQVLGVGMMMLDKGVVC